MHAGEVHVLAGENGAGKSTLLRIMAGVLSADSGAFLGEGRPLDGDVRAALTGRVAMIHQELSLAPSMSVLDNLFLGREPVGRFGRVNRREELRRGREALARVGLDIDVERPVGMYALGVRQLIEIAKALLREASILLMDEPTSALSKPEVLRLFELMRDLVSSKDRPTGIVYISHRMEEIYAVADRITVLRDGRLVASAPAATLPANALVHAMVGREIDQAPTRPTLELGNEALRLERVTIGGDVALTDLSFALRRGEILGLAGLQGSGTGTLLRALFAAQPEARVLSGDLTLAGTPWTPGVPERAIARGIAYVPEDRGSEGLCRGLSIRANLALPSLAQLAPRWLRSAVSGAKERALAERGRDRFRVRSTSIDQGVGQLSGGNQQKVALGKWLLREPTLLLLHEPTRGVDIGAREEIERLIREATGRGAAVLLVSTDLNELLGLSDRILVLHRGRIVAEFDATDATPHGVISAAFGEAGERAAGDAA